MLTYPGCCCCVPTPSSYGWVVQDFFCLSTTAGKCKAFPAVVKKSLFNAPLPPPASYLNSSYYTALRHLPPNNLFMHAIKCFVQHLHKCRLGCIYIFPSIANIFYTFSFNYTHISLVEVCIFLTFYVKVLFFQIQWPILPSFLIPHQPTQRLGAHCTSHQPPRRLATCSHSCCIAS